ncbi:NADH-quinone oxidoreductase subunit NuoG [Polymorphobacter fuscus]|uniref:NADH-quinone oxidoreductase n=1 Tax=Sandarakinorhabdus fusca TaxID=1439888 RepID=A0A7C9GMC9_9SPHN|nr:NADH-quinone oxidoreductase subunit NuoG [Polymorphobacter fuscus]KAB7648396.1 NADH-quinone oxidoreductase subunit G [Polymorphobacter fuscus]MQT15912.1 NADH-quinone oxidoreductase subunit G [Polymorphobacter fuscus]NJC07812.1 NADH-quinone oxidoreductase subunit G [Polymorphobacter fuscus]
MPKLTVDGVEVEVPAGATVLQACEAAGAEIPRFCYHERLSIAGNCRMCLVEMEKSPKPVASCAMPAADGQVVMTTTAKVKKAREGVMEFLLINHPLDCPICDQGGECDLQDQSIAYGKGFTRYHENKRAVTEKFMGPLVKTTMTRCIHCTRCVRFAQEVAGVEEIGAIGRGENMQITSYLEKAVTSEVSGNIIDLCPVGALTSKPYAFQARPWELKKTDGIDVMDAIGSNIVIGSRGPAVLRVTPRINDDVNEEWLSDKARFAHDGLAERRLDRPYVRRGGALVAATWTEAFAAIKDGLAGIPGDAIAGIVGDLAAVEDMVAFKDLLGTLGAKRIESRQDGAVFGSAGRSDYLFNSGLAGIENADVVVLVGCDPRREAPLLNVRLRKKAARGLSKVFAIGPAVDLSYPVTWLGDDAGLLANVPEALVAALAAAERPAVIVGMGALMVPGLFGAAQAFAGAHLVRDGWQGWNVLHTAAARVGALDLGLVADGVEAIAADSGVKALFLLGADEVDAGAGAFTVYIGTHGDRGVRHADVILPAAAFSEKPGTWVNLEGRVQRGLRAVFPPGDAREDWTILRALSAVLGQPLPYDDLPMLRARIGAEWPHLAGGEAVVTTPGAALPAMPAPTGPLPLAISNYYLTNPIARASETMADCVAQILQPLQEAAE